MFALLARIYKDEIQAKLFIVVQQTPWIWFFLINVNLHPKFPRARAKPTRWKFATFAYYHREKPDLKWLS